MTTAPRYLIYLVYGSVELCAEAVYSLLSYYEVAELPAKVLIYTNLPEYFATLLGSRPEIAYPPVSAQEWQAWRGESNQVYMMKISVLQHARQHYPGSLLFVDTDTIWLADPAPLFAAVAQGRHVMHLSEGRLATGNLLNRKVYQHLQPHTFAVGGRELRLTPQTVLYNSGVIGYARSEATQLSDIYALADRFFLLYNKHIMEQLALSVCLALDGPILEAAPYVLHYWNLKAIRPVLVRLLEKYRGRPPAELYQRLAALNIPALHAAELRYRLLPGWRRSLLKLLGRQWQLGEVGIE